MCLSEFEYVCLSENKFVNSVNNVNYGFLVVCGNFNYTFISIFHVGWGLTNNRDLEASGSIGNSASSIYDRIFWSYFGIA